VFSHGTLSFILWTIDNFKLFKDILYVMGIVDDTAVFIEYNTISDKDSKPEACDRCGCSDLINPRKISDRQDMGKFHLARRSYYERYLEHLE